MELCKSGTTIYQIIRTLKYPHSEELYFDVKDINGTQQIIQHSKVTVVTQAERTSFEQQLASKTRVVETPSRFGPSAPSASSVPSVPSVRRSEAFSPPRVYSLKACTLPKRVFHKFELMDLSSRSHGGIAGMIPGVCWKFIGNCVETDSESLDLFQFDAAGKSAFQDNFFNHYHTLVSYCVEKGKHYACFTPTSEEIINFVAWFKAQEQVVKLKLKEYMSYAAIEEYRHFVEVAERAKQRYLLEAQRAEQVRRDLESQRELQLLSQRENHQRQEFRQRELELLSQRENHQRQEFRRQYAVEPSTMAASRGMPFALPSGTFLASPRETPMSASRGMPVASSTLFASPRETLFASPRETLFASPRETPFASPRETPFASPRMSVPIGVSSLTIERINEIKRQLGLPIGIELNREQERVFMRAIGSNPPGQGVSSESCDESSSKFGCIKKKSGRN